ncbi:MAG TPA: hypothetical protein VNO75_02680 [Gemmatimonadaceae bacterium]|nr:hypothetical protein [Gemmatimonadaceae bacterium]
MLTKSVRRLFAAVAIAPLLITACDSNPFDPFDEATGTYQLSIFATRSMPATIPCEPGECEGLPNGGTIRVNSGTLTLHNNGTFTEENQFTFTPNGGGSFNDEFVSIGTYTINGEDLTLSDPDHPNGDRFVNASLEFLSGNDVRISYEEGNPPEAYEYIKR